MEFIPVAEETGLAPESLTLEITEIVLMDDPDAVSIVFEKLKKLGVRLHLDDFGTGYSSLSFLHRFRFDAIKLDRMFVHKVDRSDENRQIVRAIVNLARSLGIRVIAEGVETRAQLEQLKKLDCHFGQGYYFATPLDGSQLAGFLRSRPDWVP